MDEEQPETPVTITDKRQRGMGKSNDLPTAEELLADEQPGTFEQQAREEAERQARWDAMTDDEKQAELARQAAEVDGVPFTGAGMQAPPDEHAGKKRVLSMFVIVVHPDGTAVATDNMDTSMFEPEFPPDGGIIYRSVCEIKKDIESTDAATHTLRFMNQHAAMAMQQAQTEALAGQLGRRGTGPRRG